MQSVVYFPHLFCLAVRYICRLVLLLYDLVQHTPVAPQEKEAAQGPLLCVAPVSVVHFLQVAEDTLIARDR